MTSLYVGNIPPHIPSNFLEALMQIVSPSISFTQVPDPTTFGAHKPFGFARYTPSAQPTNSTPLTPCPMTILYTFLPQLVFNNVQLTVRGQLSPTPSPAGSDALPPRILVRLVAGTQRMLRSIAAANDATSFRTEFIAQDEQLRRELEGETDAQVQARIDDAWARGALRKPVEQSKQPTTSQQAPASAPPRASADAGPTGAAGQAPASTGAVDVARIRADARVRAAAERRRERADRRVRTAAAVAAARVEDAEVARLSETLATYERQRAQVYNERAQETQARVTRIAQVRAAAALTDDGARRAALAQLPGRAAERAREAAVDEELLRERAADLRTRHTVVQRKRKAVHVLQTPAPVAADFAAPPTRQQAPTTKPPTTKPPTTKPPPPAPVPATSPVPATDPVPATVPVPTPTPAPTQVAQPPTPAARTIDEALTDAATLNSLVIPAIRSAAQQLIGDSDETLESDVVAVLQRPDRSPATLATAVGPIFAVHTTAFVNEIWKVLDTLTNTKE